jgi:hypothetical protein
MVNSAYASESGWFGPLRITLTFLPLAVLLFLALAATARALRHMIPTDSQGA